MKTLIAQHLTRAIDDIAAEAKQQLREYAEAAHPRNWRVTVVIESREDASRRG